MCSHSADFWVYGTRKKSSQMTGGQAKYPLSTLLYGHEVVEYLV